MISIHAPLAGSDFMTFKIASSLYYFNPRSPRGERRDILPIPLPLDIFQSTLPSRGATILSLKIPRGGKYFNPRSPRGERRKLSRLLLVNKYISIHAPLAGSDSRQHSLQRRRTYFNPRSPRGERLAGDEGRKGRKEFQSTLPSRGATRLSYGELLGEEFQSTLPSRGATVVKISCSLLLIYFNPRSPRGERREDDAQVASEITISIHAPLAGSDRRDEKMD
ncbi:hypothetical protein GCWU000341_00214 [Oribacterium sp. oral taxon 078 str. F0262]|nr:hypothetical protein GCWU000341_00214 [Oribacterium sp. oral taxon 078 str. F0262]